MKEHEKNKKFIVQIIYFIGFCTFGAGLFGAVMRSAEGLPWELVIAPAFDYFLVGCVFFIIGFALKKFIK